VLRAVSTCRRWLSEVAEQGRDDRPTPAPIPSRTAVGVILNVDIGNSTQILLSAKGAAGPAGHLPAILEALCQLVPEHHGSLMSFTGDGFIALFEAKDFANEGDAATQAISTVDMVQMRLRERALALGIVGEQHLTVRAALHWGSVHIPAAGQLREQAIGPDVVCVTRVCDWLGKSIEPALPKDLREKSLLMAATEEFRKRHAKAALSGNESPGRYWVDWSKVHLKGLGEHGVYIRKRDLGPLSA